MRGTTVPAHGFSSQYYESNWQKRKEREGTRHGEEGINIYMTIINDNNSTFIYLKLTICLTCSEFIYPNKNL